MVSSEVLLSDALINTRGLSLLALVSATIQEDRAHGAEGHGDDETGQ